MFQDWHKFICKTDLNLQSIARKTRRVNRKKLFTSLTYMVSLFIGFSFNRIFSLKMSFQQILRGVFIEMFSHFLFFFHHKYILFFAEIRKESIFSTVLNKTYSIVVRLLLWFLFIFSFTNLTFRKHKIPINIKTSLKVNIFWFSQIRKYAIFNIRINWTFNQMHNLN
jgi:hypothetical protein